jgi:hypothetical protein
MEKKRVSVASALYTDETGPMSGSPDGNRDPEKGSEEGAPALTGDNSPSEEEIDDGRPTMVGKRLAVLVAYVITALEFARSSHLHWNILYFFCLVEF